MARRNHAEFTFMLPTDATLRLRVGYPVPGVVPEYALFDDAALTAALTAGEKTALINLLLKIGVKLETDFKAALDARRTAMNTDP